MVKRIHKDIKKVFEIDIKFLLENYISTKADEEDQCVLLEGMIAKIELLLRKKLKEKLKCTRKEVEGNDGTNNKNTIKN